MKKRLEQALRQALMKAIQGGELRVTSLPPLFLEVPKEKEHGDLSSNVALVLAREERRPARAIAETILRHLTDPEGLIARAEVAGPGFLNFSFSWQFWHRSLAEVEQAGEIFGLGDLGHGKSVQLEFVSANPTGPLHVGHGRNAATGDALARLLEATGHRVVREYYVNDAGQQMESLGISVYYRWRQLKGEQVKLPGDTYPGEYIVDIARKIRQREASALEQAEVPGVLDHLVENAKSDREAIARCRDYAARVLLDQIVTDLTLFGVCFDNFVHEKDLRERGAVNDVLQELQRRGHLYEQDGALWFRSTAFGDDKDRPVVKQGGELTYFAGDIAYHRDKLSRGFQRLVNVWGADHHGHIPRLRAALQALGIDPDAVKVILVQMVNLTRGGVPVRMGKRSGEFVTLRNIVEEVGKDAARLFFLMRKADAHLDFDLELAKKQSVENPVFYVQYAHARIASVFRQAGENGYDIPGLADADLTTLGCEEEADLIRCLLRFPDTVESAAQELEPHRVVFYLMDLAGIFHRYYNRYRIIGENRFQTYARLLLVKNVQKVLRTGLSLLGISAPEQM